MAGNFHHNNDAYKHGVHNPSFLNTSSHMTNLDSKEPTLNSVKTFMKN